MWRFRVWYKIIPYHKSIADHYLIKKYSTECFEPLLWTKSMQESAFLVYKIEDICPCYVIWLFYLTSEHRKFNFTSDVSQEEWKYFFMITSEIRNLQRLEKISFLLCCFTKIFDMISPILKWCNLVRTIWR